MKCDLLIIGGGPAALSCATYAASEGLDTIIVYDGQPGGQIAASPRVENVPLAGRHPPISGSQLGARMYEQAVSFGVLPLAARAEVLQPEAGGWLVDGEHFPESFEAHAIVLAVGQRPLRLETDLGRPVYYSVHPDDLPEPGERVLVLGGGNSAGQAVLELCQHATSVDVVCPCALHLAMSTYLVHEIETRPNVQVHTQKRAIGYEQGFVCCEGEETLFIPADRVYCFIGTAPDTSWLAEHVHRDEKGFILAPNYTCWPGLFAIGDVRSGSTKRATAAMGEGASVLPLIHSYIAERKQ